MNTSHALAGEFVIAVAVTSWGALKQGKVPWPGSVTRTGLAFALLGGLSVASPDLAVLLGAGTLLAVIIGDLDMPGATWTRFAATPPNLGDAKFPYYTLGF